MIFLLLLAVYCCWVLGSGNQSALAASQVVTLQLDGETLTTDTTPAIVGSRVLLSGRVLFEALGGEVSYEHQSKTTTIEFPEQTIELTINDTTAYVNGDALTLDVPAQIINSRTMLPLRFVAETSGCRVDWDNTKKLVAVTSADAGNDDTPAETKPTVVTLSAVSMEEGANSYQLVIQAGAAMQRDGVSIQNNGNTCVITVDYAKLPITPKTVAGFGALFDEMTLKQLSNNKVQITLDLQQSASGSISFSSDRKTCTIDFGSSVKPTTATPGSVSGLPTLDPAAANKLVVIDAGHGGSDPGSSGTDASGTLYEKTVNLAVAVRANELLQQAGVRTYMIRTGDETIATSNRPTIANLIDADMFVSIHNNSFTQPTASGTETLWYDGSKNTQALYGITSKRLATIAQEQLAERLGLNDRGLKERSGLIVLKNTKMPAFLMEGAFLSSPSDLAFMRTSEFTEQFAMATAYTVIQGLNESVQ